MTEHESREMAYIYLVGEPEFKLIYSIMRRGKQDISRADVKSRVGVKSALRCGAGVCDVRVVCVLNDPGSPLQLVRQIG